MLELRDPELPSFLDMPEQDISHILERARRDRARFTDLVVLGIGGSSLGTRAVYRALRRPHTHAALDAASDGGPALRLHFIENVDGVEVNDLLSTLPFKTTLFNVVTKSGNTIETLSLFSIVRARLLEEIGEQDYLDHLVFTTDPERGPLRALARREGIASFDVPPGVGGRFSVLSAVGLYPLACAGIDVAELLKGAATVRDGASDPSLEDNAAALFAYHQYSLYMKGMRQVVLMPYCRQLQDLSFWFVQLWAESLGKRRRRDDGSLLEVGPTPIAALGVTDQHSQLQLYMEGPSDRSVVFIDVGHYGDDVMVPSVRGVIDGMAHIGGRPLDEIRRAELEGVREGLAESDRPTATLSLPKLSAESVGGLLMFLECATAIAGGLFGIDPYNQPGVELGKRYAHGLLGREKESHYAEKFRVAVENRIKMAISF
jgi:glucose-6-phosphate isomerase